MFPKVLCQVPVVFTPGIMSLPIVGLLELPAETMSSEAIVGPRFGHGVDQTLAVTTCLSRLRICFYMVSLRYLFSKQMSE